MGKNLADNVYVHAELDDDENLHIRVTGFFLLKVFLTILIFSWVSKVLVFLALSALAVGSFLYLGILCRRAVEHMDSQDSSGGSS